MSAVEFVLSENFSIKNAVLTSKNSFSNNVFTIEVSDFLITVLQNCNFEQRLKKLVFEQFQSKIEVKTLVLADDNSNLEYQKKINNLYDANYKNSPAEDNKRYELPKYEDVKVENLNMVNFKELPILLDGAEIICGKTINSPIVKISDITGPVANVTIWGDVFFVESESRITRAGAAKQSVQIGITDYTASLPMETFLNEDQSPLLAFKKGDTGLFRGKVEINKYKHGELFFYPTDIMKISKVPEKDEAEVKRVELHAHTNMSASDAIAPVDALIKKAYSLGHKAVAITDHGVVQSFPLAALTVGRLRDNPEDFKLIYGCEAYFVNDFVQPVKLVHDKKIMDELIVFDLETTGLSSSFDAIIQYGAVKIRGLEVVDKFCSFVNPEREIPAKITELTSITNENVIDAPSQREALDRFIEFCGDSPVLIAHNSAFDCGFINSLCRKLGVDFKYTEVDTLNMSRTMITSMKQHKLDQLAKHFKVGGFDHHLADEDARVLSEIFKNLAQMLIEDKEIEMISEINSALQKVEPKTLKPFHQILLVKDLIGLKNLYRLVSLSHLEHFYKKPKLPKSELLKYREGLIIGSACEAGEVIQAILKGEPWEDILEVAKFYDYLEVQPIGNNEFMIRSERYPEINSHEDLRDINRKVVKIGEELGIPVVATCDVHFLNKGDAIFREVLFSNRKSSDGEEEDVTLLYLRKTNEMLDEFSYLGDKKAYEVVVENSNLISDMINPNIVPVPSGLFTPEIEGSEDTLRRITHEKMTEVYGENPHQIVKDRLDRELNAIINHGYAVLYMIAQKLVKDSNDNGYSVGSRGSVGSSFVASMAGISEVNPLPPHYICPKCKYTEFLTDGTYGSGYDLDAKDCPECGTPLGRDGHDIPFETFLGFKGDKVPDIDLNFSGEYQSSSHNYTVTLFGEENVFKAGTIGTIQEKSGVGFARMYAENRGVNMSSTELKRLALGITGIKRTTGQHAGGMMVLPDKYEIYDFTPIQRPADKMDSELITTHFEYSYLHDNLMKLDQLGHTAPTLFKHLEDITGINQSEIFPADPKVMSLFESPAALGVSAEEIDCELGILALPEIGTGFSQQIVLGSKPKTFSDLLQISGLSHGTGVWEGNAKSLIEDGICDISQVIGTRDGIMTYLIYHDIDPSMAFKIMEFTRKGNAKKFLTDEIKQMMLDHKVPQWYIDSCLKIQYMFPKAHAAAYMIAALRLAWFKLYEPLAFYAAFFTVKCQKDRIIEAPDVINGLGYVRKIMAEKREAIKNLPDNEVNKKKTAKNEYEGFIVVNEMMSRGYEFLPIDIFKSHYENFSVEDGKIRLPLNSISGVSSNEGKKIYDYLHSEEGTANEILSCEELKDSAGISKGCMETLFKIGAMGDLPESNQLSLF